MVALSSKVLLLEQNTLVFLMGDGKAELVCQGHLTDSRAAIHLPIQMEPCVTPNLYTVRFKLEHQSEAKEKSELLASVFNIIFPWEEPGYAPFGTDSPSAVRRQ